MEERRVREFVAGGWGHRPEEAVSEAASDSSLVTEWGLWDLSLEPEGTIRMRARVLSSQSAGGAGRLKAYGRRMIRAARTALPSGRPDDEARILLDIRPDDAGALMHAIPAGIRMIVVL